METRKEVVIDGKQLRVFYDSERGILRVNEMHIVRQSPNGGILTERGVNVFLRGKVMKHTDPFNESMYTATEEYLIDYVHLKGLSVGEASCLFVNGGDLSRALKALARLVATE